MIETGICPVVGLHSGMRYFIVRIVSLCLIPAILCDGAAVNEAMGSVACRPGRRTENVVPYADQVLAPAPPSAWSARPHAAIMRWAKHRTLLPANSFGFYYAKVLGAKGKLAFYVGAVSTLIESTALSIWFGHAAQGLPIGSFVLRFPRAIMDLIPNGSVGPIQVLAFSFLLSFGFRLIEHRQWDRNFWLRDLWNQNLLVRFSVFAPYAILALPWLQNYHHVPLMISMFGVVFYNYIRGHQVFSGELMPVQPEDANSRGVELAKAIRDADEGHYNLHIAVLDFDELAAYGQRLGVHGQDIMDQILQVHFWGENGIIKTKLSFEVDKAHVVGGDETYLCFPVMPGKSLESLENTRQSLEKLREAFREYTRILFVDLASAIGEKDEVERIQNILGMDQVPEPWLRALREACGNGKGALPPLTFSGALFSYEDLKEAKTEFMQQVAENKIPVRELFSIVRATSMVSIGDVKKNKHQLSPGVMHTQLIPDRDTIQREAPDIWKFEDLFNLNVVGNLSDPDKSFVTNRDPGASPGNLSNIPNEVSFREFKKWKKNLAKIGVNRQVILGSLTHEYSGATLAPALMQLSKEPGVRKRKSGRGGIKALLTWDKSTSAPDLIFAMEHTLWLRAVDHALNGMNGFRPGQLSVLLQSNAPDTPIFAWVPDGNPTDAQIRDFESRMRTALLNYHSGLKDILKVRAGKKGDQEINISPNLALLRVTNLPYHLDNLSLKRIHDLIYSAQANDESTLTLFAKLERENTLSQPEVPAGASMTIVKIYTTDLQGESVRIETERKIDAQKVLGERWSAENAATMEKASPKRVEPTREAA